MDGLQCKQLFLDAIDERTESDIFQSNPRQLYNYLDAAAIEFVRQTRSLTKETSITTVAGTQTYDLPPDFINLTMQNRDGKYYLKYYDGTTYSFPALATHERIFRDNHTDSQSTPLRFAIIPQTTPPDLLSGTTTDAGAVVSGQCVLTDSAADFVSAGKVYPRDTVHNVNDSSHGIVLSVTDQTHIITALFNGSRNNWKNADSYVIQRASAKSLYLDAPSASSGHIITIPYVSMPSPVYSDYGFWGFPEVSCRAICYEAGFLWQNRKGDYISADRHHILFRNEVSQIKGEKAQQILNATKIRRGW